MTKDMSSAQQAVEDKILHILKHFPILSPSMLQISLGSGIPTPMWRPILEDLIQRGSVYRYRKSVVTPTGRAQMQTMLSSLPPPKSDDIFEFSTDEDPVEAGE